MFGQTVTADQHPYVASSTSSGDGHSGQVPRRLVTGLFQRLTIRNRDGYPRLPKQSIGGRDGGQSLRIAFYKPRRDWHGKDLAAISKLEKKPVLDIVLDIQRNGGAQVVSFGMNEEEVRLIMKQPFVATASDGSSQVPSTSVPHPRSYGCFARKIGRYAIEDGVISVEHAVRASSGLPADILKLTDRGYLKPGHTPTLVFDPRITATPRPTASPVCHWRTLRIRQRCSRSKKASGGTLAGKVLRHPVNSA